MRPRIVFDKEGNFVKELIGFADNDVPDSIVMERPLIFDQTNNDLFALVDGKVVIRNRTPEEVEASRGGVFRTALLDRIFSVLFRVENRIRILETRKELTKEEYRENLKKILGLGTET